MFPINGNCSNNISSELNISLKFTTIDINILHGILDFLLDVISFGIYQSFDC